MKTAERGSPPRSRALLLKSLEALLRRVSAETKGRVKLESCDHAIDAEHYLAVAKFTLSHPDDTWRTGTIYFDRATLPEAAEPHLRRLVDALWEFHCVPMEDRKFERPSRAKGAKPNVLSDLDQVADLVYIYVARRDALPAARVEWTMQDAAAQHVSIKVVLVDEESAAVITFDKLASSEDVVRRVEEVLALAMPPGSKP